MRFFKIFQENPYSLFILNYSQSKIDTLNEQNKDDVGDQHSWYICAGGDFIADSHIEMSNVPIQIESDDKYLRGNVGAIVIVKFEGHVCE